MSRILLKAVPSENFRGDTERRSGVYSKVLEHLSTGSTQKSLDRIGLCTKPVAKLGDA